MDTFGGSKFTVVSCTMRKKRSNMSRKPRSDSCVFSDTYNTLPFSLTPPLSIGIIDENPNSSGLRVVSDGLGSENKLRKLKLKVGGIIRTVHTNSTMEVAYGGESSVACGSLQQQNFQDDVDSIYSGLPDSSFRRKMSGENISLNETCTYEPARKSRRIPKKRYLDMGFDDDDYEDEEIRYLGRLHASKVAADYKDEEKEESEKKWSLRASRSRWMDDDMYANGVKDCGSALLGKDKKNNSRSETVYGDKDYLEEEEPISDDEFNTKTKKPRKDSTEILIEERKELTLLTRKRAFELGASLVDLPNGLPPAPTRKQKEKLSEVEQQLKRAEALQRRRMQSEKAAREAEAEAIRKILGQDSSRKKKEDKMKRMRDKLAEGKASNNVLLPSNSVRWIMGPTGTVVTFSEDIGLPNIFNQMGCSYPPPREKCVGPNCTNAYKYRDSKSKLPLCSLNCYKAIHEKVQPLIAC